MDSDVLEVWLIKRALIVGVEKVRVRPSRLGPPFVVEVDGRGQTYVLDEEAYLDRAQAIAAAEGDRARRIRSLEDQIERLRRIDFEADPD